MSKEILLGRSTHHSITRSLRSPSGLAPRRGSRQVPRAGRRSRLRPTPHMRFLLRTEKRHESVYIEVAVDKFALVFDGPAIQTMLTSDGCIRHPRSVSIEHFGCLVDPGGFIRMGDMARDRMVIQPFKGSTATSSIPFSRFSQPSEI